MLVLLPDISHIPFLALSSVMLVLCYKRTHYKDWLNPCSYLLLDTEVMQRASLISPYFDWENIKINYETLFTISSTKIVFSIQG